MHAVLEELLEAQHDCVAVWQLRAAAWTRRQVERRLPASGLRPVRGIDGVWTSTRGGLTPLQRWSAATLTAPGTALSHISSASLQGFGDPPAGGEKFTVVTRAGTGGPRRHGSVLVHRSAAHVAILRENIPVTPPALTLADLAAHLHEAALRRAVIEALRLSCVEHEELVAELEARPRRHGAPRLRRVIDDVAGLPVARCRSNAEGEALVRRKRAGRGVVAVNVRIAGYEADLVDLERREIVEIDGPAFHQDSALDERKAAAWSARGFTVIRRPSADAYDAEAIW
jgi:hypothetical protein